MDAESKRLLAEFEAGNESAAAEIYQRYLRRLIALAHSRISDQLGRFVDAQDLVQSVYRSFFSEARRGEVTLARDGDLWRLLAAITINKVRGRARFYQQQKRDMRRDVDVTNDSFAVHPEAFACEPTEEEALSVLDEINLLMKRLSERSRDIITRRLQGQGMGEIATELNCSTRTIRRALDEIEIQLQDRLDAVR